MKLTSYFDKPANNVFLYIFLTDEVVLISAQLTWLVDIIVQKMLSLDTEHFWISCVNFAPDHLFILTWVIFFFTTIFTVTQVNCS